MKINFTILFTALLLISCNKKELKLPKIGLEGVKKVHNNSEVWMFYNETDSETPFELNKNNTISTTHWLFNIDKRIPMQHIIPHLIDLKHKHASGVHSKEGMGNYFSYSDTISNELSYLSFDKLIYKTDSIQSKLFIKDQASDYANYNNLNITINPTNTWINDAKMEDGELNTTLPEFIEFSSEGRQTMLHLNFNHEISYQDYLSFKAYFNNLTSPAILINNTEFIFDPAKVPDCGCE